MRPSRTILLIRGAKVILDSDLAMLSSVLNSEKAIKSRNQGTRNRDDRDEDKDYATEFVQKSQMRGYEFYEHSSLRCTGWNTVYCLYVLILIIMISI